MMPFLFKVKVKTQREVLMICALWMDSQWPCKVIIAFKKPNLYVMNCAIYSLPLHCE